MIVVAVPSAVQGARQAGCFRSALPSGRHRHTPGQGQPDRSLQTFRYPAGSVHRSHHAVTVRADILYQRNMEARTSMTDSLCILSHFPVEKLVCTAVWIVNRIKTTGTDAAAASFAFVIVNDCFFIHIGNCIASAFFCTAAAARQTSVLIAGFPLACCCIFPARLPHPIPIFSVHRQSPLLHGL